eukprot:2050996-Amphidinium_carterae.1
MLGVNPTGWITGFAYLGRRVRRLPSTQLTDQACAQDTDPIITECYHDYAGKPAPAPWLQHQRLLATLTLDCANVDKCEHFDVRVGFRSTKQTTKQEVKRCTIWAFALER